MKWYHYTSFSKLLQIVIDESLLSHCEQLIRDCNNDPERISGVKRTAKELHEKEAIEYHRNSNVFLTATPQQKCGAFSYDIRLQFELEEQPNFGCHLALPKISLSYLDEIVAAERRVHDIKQVLQERHDGKYANIPVFAFPPKQ